jgi:hypothetical protein
MCEYDPCLALAAGLVLVYFQRPMRLSKAVEHPYSRAKGWCGDVMRVKLSDQKASDYRRIAMLGDAWGRRLDALGATFWMLRWLAGASAAKYAVERDARYRALLHLLESTAPGEERRAAFRDLMAKSPKLGRSGARATMKAKLSGGGGEVRAEAGAVT